MAHVVITGAAGFIGSHLSEAMLATGWRVTGMDSFDNFYSPETKRGNISTFLKNKHFNLIEADIRDKETVNRVFSNDVDVIVHLAARAGVRSSIEQPILYEDVNVTGTYVLLDSVQKHKIPKFVFASSSSVYGNNKKIPFAESDNVDFPISPYAATKRAGELICHTYHHLYNIDITCLRFFTVYGARQRPDLAIHKFARLIEKDEPIPVYGDGSMMRDHTYIDDIVAGVLTAVERCKGYNIYNLGNSNPISLNDLIVAIESALKKEAIINSMPLQPGDVERTFADVSLAKTELAYEPKTNLEVGLKHFVDWLHTNRPY